MYILLFFAFLAGFVTVLSPCILPVLPILLAAGTLGGRLRPLGIIIGVVTSFTFFTISLAVIIQATGVSPDILRYLAIGLIVFFGLTMIFPSIGEWFAARSSGIANIGNRLQENTEVLGSGFWGGFLLGASLGLIWTPCAGPILATIITLVATEAISWMTFLVTFFYSLGSALPMLLVVYGGVAITNSIPFVAQYTELIRKIFGVLMILAALAIAFHFDVILQQLAIRYFPTIRLEESSLVQKELEKLRTSTSSTSEVPAVGKKAPEFIGITAWINSPALNIGQLKGKIVLVDFWTYSCINCVRTLPYLKQWYASYKDKGLVLVGIHTPEFEFEKNSANVKDAVKRFGIEYPVGLDTNFKTWQNYHNRFWPAHYLIDQEGIIRYIHFGEGNYVETENAIRALLGLPAVDKKEQQEAVKAQTPETYLGYERGASYRDALKRNESALYDYTGPLADDKVGLRGMWFAANQYIQSKSDTSRLDLNFIASHVYCVMEAKQESAITVLLDGKPLPTKYFSKDSNKQGQVVVKESRMYEILDLKGDYGRHMVTLEVPMGVALYAFTFGS